MAKAERTMLPPMSPRRRRGGALELSAWRGQLVIRARKKRKGPRKSWNQQALVDQFSALAYWSKWADPAARVEAEEQAAGTGWYWRDVIVTAMVGKLHQFQEGKRITTPTALVYRTTAETLSAGIETVLTPTLARWDNNYFWSSITNPSRLTVRTAGVYLVGATTFWNNNSTNRRKLVLLVNGTTRIAEQSAGAGQSSSINQNATAIWYFEAGDYVQVLSSQLTNSGTVTLQHFWILAITPETVVSP